MILKHSIAAIVYSTIFAMSLHSLPANATEYIIKLINITPDGAGYCEAFYNINTPNPFTINNINIKVGGATNIDSPGYWQLFSPVDAGMPLTIFGFSVTTATHKYYEYNTTYHNGALSTVLWQLRFQEPVGGCAQFNARLAYDVTP